MYVITVHSNTGCNVCSAQVVVATPGRLVDMFARKHAAFDLSASVKTLVRFKIRLIYYIFLSLLQKSVFSMLMGYECRHVVD